MQDIPESRIKSKLAKNLYADRIYNKKRIFQQYKRGFLTQSNVWDLYMLESCNMMFWRKVLTDGKQNEYQV